MRKVCFILNAFYPFNSGETFLANELEYLNKFDDIYICPIYMDKARNRFQYKRLNMTGIHIVEMEPYSLKHKLRTSIKAFRRKELYDEINVLIKSKRCNIHNLIKAFKFISHGIFWTEIIQKQIKSHIQSTDKVMLYSYWMNNDAYIACLLKTLNKNRDFSVISRAHRVDIYEYADKAKYIPLRNYIFKHTDVLYPISEDGKNYLISEYSIDKNKIKVARLGTEDKGVNISVKGKELKIVSCSWIRKVKRLDLLVEALANIDIPISWTHFGDGEQYDNIKRMIDVINNPNVKCVLKGATPNQEVLKSYNSDEYNVFINVSKSEGVPVSIMEAMSFGKVIIATDVGGSGEIVNDGVNGFLLKPDCSCADIIEALRKVYYMDNDIYNEMCMNSRLIWEKLCSAEQNYKRFADTIGERLIYGNPE